MFADAAELGKYLLAQKQSVTCAESCTGGMIAAAITDIAGSSDWFSAGFVTYSNAAKNQILGIDEDVLRDYGAVSEPTVRAMASAAQKKAKADWAVAVSGIAGPTGGSIEKPVGTVWFAYASPQKHVWAKCFRLTGNRAAVREQAVEIALKELLIACQDFSVSA